MNTTTAATVNATNRPQEYYDINMVAEVGPTPTSGHGIELNSLNNEILMINTANHRGEEQAAWTPAKATPTPMSPTPGLDGSTRDRGRKGRQDNKRSNETRSRSGQRADDSDHGPPARRMHVPLPACHGNDTIVEIAARLSALEKQHHEDVEWSKGLDEAIRFAARQHLVQHTAQVRNIEAVSKRAEFANKKADDNNDDIQKANMAVAEMTKFGFPGTYESMGKKIIDLDTKHININAKIENLQNVLERQDLENKMMELKMSLEQTNTLADDALKRNEASILMVKAQEESTIAKLAQLQRDLFHEFGSLRAKASSIMAPTPAMSPSSGPAATEMATLTAYVNRTEIDGMSQKIDNIASRVNINEKSMNANSQESAETITEMMTQLTALATEVNGRDCHCHHLDELDAETKASKIELEGKLSKLQDELKKTQSASTAKTSEPALIPSAPSQGPGMLGGSPGMPFMGQFQQPLVNGQNVMGQGQWGAPTARAQGPQWNNHGAVMPGVIGATNQNSMMNPFNGNDLGINGPGVGNRSTAPMQTTMPSHQPVWNGADASQAMPNHGGMAQAMPSQFQAPGGGWNGGAPAWNSGGGHGGGDRQLTAFTKLFEVKVADEKPNQYDGVNGGASWFKETKKYFIGQAADCIPLLQWAEMHGESTITSHEVAWLAQSNNIGCQSDPTLISGHMWSYLCRCLKGNAGTLFEQVEPRNGLEAWRMIFKWIGYGSQDRVEELRKKLRQPPTLKDLSLLDVVLADWEKDIQEFESAGGEKKSEGELKGILNEILPMEFRRNLIWTNDQFPTYLALKHHVRAQVRLFLRVTGTSKSGMHLLEGEQHQEQPSLNDIGDLDEDMLEKSETGRAILALAKKFSRGNLKKQYPKAGNPKERPAKTGEAVTEPRCGNCGKKGHMAAACKEPRIEVAARKCWECGQTGHVATRCPKRVNLVEGYSTDDENDFCFMFDWERLDESEELFEDNLVNAYSAADSLVCNPGIGRLCRTAGHTHSAANGLACKTGIVLLDMAGHTSQTATTLLQRVVASRTRTTLLKHGVGVPLSGVAANEISVAANERPDKKNMNEDTDYDYITDDETIDTMDNEPLACELSFEDYFNSCTRDRIQDFDKYFGSDPSDPNDDTDEEMPIAPLTDDSDEDMSSDGESDDDAGLLHVKCQNAGYTPHDAEEKQHPERVDSPPVAPSDQTHEWLGAPPGFEQHAVDASGEPLESPLMRSFPKRSEDIEDLLHKILNTKDTEERHSALQGFLMEAADAAWIRAFEELCRIEDNDEDEQVEEFEIIDDIMEHGIDYEIIEDDLEVMDWISVVEHMYDDLMPVDTPKEGIEVTVAIDSGAVDHVADDGDMPGIEVVPSAASIAGKHFMGANGKTIINKGQAAVRMKAPDTGAMINSVFQVAQVSRPLYSVSKICDSGCEVTFNNKEGRVLTKSGKLIATFPRRGGLYVNTFLVKPSDPSKHKEMGFTRHA